jgi:hypothetical protein
MVVRKWSVSDLDDETGLLSVTARLDEPPPMELAECFWNEYDGPEWPEGLEAPALDSVLITFRVRPDDVLRYREALRSRLAAANRRYATVVVPAARAAEAAARAREENRARIIAEAQRLFDRDPSTETDAGLVYDPTPDAIVEHGAGLAYRMAERGGRDLAAPLPPLAVVEPEDGL